MARDLHRDPLWQAADLGSPIPDSPHAVSVCLPTWQHVIGYEEQDPAVLEALQCGYPRFVCHPRVRELCRKLSSDLPSDKQVIVFPNAASAARCAAFLERNKGTGIEFLNPLTDHSIHPISFPSNLQTQAWNYWRFCGEIVSSRQADAALTNRASGTSASADHRMRERLASWSGQPASNIFLFPSGMAAIFALHQAALQMRPDAATIQLEFPYVDAMRVQQHFGRVHFFQHQADGETSKQISDLLERETIAAIFCETPSNPLLQTVDLPGIATEAARREVPLFVDDTVATVHNIDVTAFADAITTSLTKNISGQGDVMAGAVTVRKGSPFEAALCDHLARRDGPPLWIEDLEILETNSRDFPTRMNAVNRSTEAVFDYLKSHREVEKIWFPKTETRQNFESLRRANSGYGGLLSIQLRNGATTAPAFFDALRLNKGPSLGTNYSLACPYTLLAHYDELDFARNCGVPTDLIRFAIGLEDPDDLISRLEKAFTAAGM